MTRQEKFLRLDAKLQRIQQESPLLAHAIVAGLAFSLTVIACSILILLDSIARGLAR